MDENNEIVTRSKKRIMESLDVIKKAKINNYIFKPVLLKTNINRDSTKTTN